MILSENIRCLGSSPCYVSTFSKCPLFGIQFNATVWLMKDSLQMAYARINDVHPMGYLRINGTLQQYDEFLDFYGITEGDGMYLAPEDRVAIW